jgi:hypothetical protein
MENGNDEPKPQAGKVVRTLQIIFLFFLQENNLSKSSYPPQSMGTMKSTPLWSVSK